MRCYSCGKICEFAESPRCTNCGHNLRIECDCNACAGTIALEDRQAQRRPRIRDYFHSDDQYHYYLMKMGIERL